MFLPATFQVGKTWMKMKRRRKKKKRRKQQKSCLYRSPKGT
jgi:hypothetical protein